MPARGFKAWPSGLCKAAPAALEEQDGRRQGQDAELGQTVQMEDGMETQGELGGGRRDGQHPVLPRLLLHTSVKEMALPERLSLAPLAHAAPSPGPARPRGAGGSPGRAASAHRPEGPRSGENRPGPAPSLRGCGEVIGADSGCGPPRSARVGSRARGGGEKGSGGRGGVLSAAAPPPAPGGPPRRAARQRPRPGARGPGTAGPNLPAAARPAPAAAPLPSVQHGRSRSAGSTVRFRFRPSAADRGHAHPSRRGLGHVPPDPRHAFRPRPPLALTVAHGNSVWGAGVWRCPAAQARAGRGRRPAEAARAEAAPFPGNGSAAGAGSGVGAGSGAMSGGSGRRRRLVLHVDLNNTVVAADAVSGQGPRAALNTFLSTVTWGRAGAAGEWQWASDRPSLRPPCPGVVSYYSCHGRDLAFTEAGPGRCFRGLHARHLQLLEWPGLRNDVFSVRGEESKHYHLILPSFFRLLDTLHREGRAFTVIFRTFGTDLPRALRAVSSALAGQHPQFPTLRDVELPVDLTPGQIRCSKREVVLTRGAERLATREDGRKLYDYFSSFEGIGGFQDHFDWWARNQFSSQGGKPLWIDPHDPDVHHIFIDDNIRLDDADTIVHPQVFSERGSSSPRRAPTSELYDICLVQTDLLEAIADEDYFLRCVRRCEENYDRYLARTEKDTPSQQWDGQ
ncbi:uncharacterized protein LJ264_008213 [Porphyrio hochstetteri]